MFKKLIGPTSVAFVVMGCATSLQKMKENSLNFERCYVTQFQEEMADSARVSCWRTWLEKYTEEQSYDRIRYAENQISMLTNAKGSVEGSSSDTDAQAEKEIALEDQGGEQEPEEQIKEVIVEQETGGSDEHPSITVTVKTQKKKRIPSPPILSFTGPCAELCKKQWNACFFGHETEISRHQDSCERKFRVCSHGCF